MELPASTAGTVAVVPAAAAAVSVHVDVAVFPVPAVPAKDDGAQRAVTATTQRPSHSKLILNPGQNVVSKHILLAVAVPVESAAVVAAAIAVAVALSV